MRTKADSIRTVALGFLGAGLFTIVSHAAPAVAQLAKVFVVRLQDTTPGTTQTGHVNISGTSIAGQFQGSGSGLTGLNASNVTTGTLADVRLSNNVARRDQANLFGVGPNQFNGFLGVGRNSQVTSSESFGIGLAAPSFDGMYVRTAPSGKPYYGYSLGGSVSAYTYVDGTDGGKWKLNVGGDRMIVSPSGFTGLGRGIPVTGNESFGIGNTATGFDGMYVRTAAAGLPFYGYSLNGSPSAYHFVDGQDQGKWKLIVGSSNPITSQTNGLTGFGTSSPQATVHVNTPSGTVYSLLVASAQGGGYGVNSQVSGGNESYALYGRDVAGDGYAVYSSGDLVVLGNKSFMIDHPLDPEDRYLRHFCTESPVPQNSYSGNIVTGSDGKAWVTLPEYFAAINTNIKYQLTVLDEQGTKRFPIAKIGREIEGNRFLVISSVPNVKVSWRIEADRNDLWVQKHGAMAEELKPDWIRGTYLRPELYGKPENQSEDHARFERQARLRESNKP